MSEGDLLVVAGEASGDRAAAGVVRGLGGVATFGIGGEALASADVELVADLRDFTAMGTLAVALRARRLLRAFSRIVAAAKERRPRAALLVDFTEFNVRLAPRLRRMGTRVLWYGAPQVWAWRPKRAAAISTIVDHMAVMLPFEEALWRDAGATVTYVGHHALETTMLDRDAARHALGMTDLAPAVAILPGSRPHEVETLLPLMLEAFELVRADRASIDARVLLAPSLDPATLGRAAELCARYRVPRVTVDAQRGVARWIRAFDIAVAASGTVSLECALGGVPPIVAYKVDRVSELVARRMMSTELVALPNILLGQRAFPELLQEGLSTATLRAAIEDMLGHREDLVASLAAVRSAFGEVRDPSQRVARILAPWLGLVPPPSRSTQLP